MNEPPQPGFPLQPPQIFDYGIQQPNYSRTTRLVYHNGPLARDTHLTLGPIYWDTTSSSSPSTIPDSFFDYSSGVANTPSASGGAEEPGPGGTPTSGFVFEQAPYGNTPGATMSGIGGDLLGTPNRADEINAMESVVYGSDPLSNLPADAAASGDLLGVPPRFVAGLGFPKSNASSRGHYNIGGNSRSNYDASAQYHPEPLKESEFGAGPNQRSNLDNRQVSTMIKRIDHRRVKREFASEFAQADYRTVFSIPITPGFGRDIRIFCVFSGASRADVMRARRLKPEYSGAKPAVSQEETLPILPAEGPQDTVLNIGKVLDDIVQDPSLLSSWVSTAGENSVIPEASCEILHVVCSYYQECGIGWPDAREPFRSVNYSKQQSDDILRSATKMAILSTMMSTCLSIPNHGLEELQKQFGNIDHTKWMAPRVVNKRVKYSVCHNLVSSTQEVLRGLSKLLREKEIRTGYIVYIVVMLAISTGTAQMSLVDTCHMTKQPGADVVIGQQVMSEIKKLEDVYSKLRCLFHRRCQAEKILRPDKFSELDDDTKFLIEELSTVSMFNGGYENLKDLNIDDIDAEDFAVDNSNRLLYQLLKPMFPD
ncbi:hypothetical protein FQN53_007885, partial [Emmonsiellopsis sp. PD_33]